MIDGNADKKIMLALEKKHRLVPGDMVVDDSLLHRSLGLVLARLVGGKVLVVWTYRSFRPETQVLFEEEWGGNLKRVMTCHE